MPAADQRRHALELERRDGCADDSCTHGRVPMIDGSMQEFALTLDRILDHAAKWHPRAQLATGCDGGKLERVSYADLRIRSLRISSVLADLGICVGDRVATLAWNTQAHVETWYAIMGMGAICHTLNPRL